jgi:predicted  nucleic acid-binding Zn-ribbon protein
VKASPEAQRRLLDLQAVDTALAQLAHRRKSLPELAEIDTVSRELSALEDERVRAQVAVDDLDRDISRFEKDIEQVRLRKQRDWTRAARCARSKGCSTSWPRSTGASPSWRTPSSS